MNILSIFRLMAPLFIPVAVANSVARTESPGQVPAPLPKPKPIVTPPMPKPGQFSQRPKASAQPSPAGGTEPTRKKADPPPLPEDRAVPKADDPRGNKAPTPSYGTTPVPWPKGSTDPVHFPKEIPKAPAARRASYSMSAQVASAYFLCDEGPEEIAKFYLDFTAREHWILVPLPGPPWEDERIIVAEKGDWTLRVDASPDPSNGRTEVFLCASLTPLPPPPKPGKKQDGEKQ